MFPVQNSARFGNLANAGFPLNYASPTGGVPPKMYRYISARQKQETYRKPVSETGFRKPVSGNRFPEIGFQIPVSRNRFPETGFRKPEKTLFNVLQVNTTRTQNCATTYVSLPPCSFLSFVSVVSFCPACLFWLFPEAGFRKPVSGNRFPERGFSEIGFRRLVSANRF